MSCTRTLALSNRPQAKPDVFEWQKEIEFEFMQMCLWWAAVVAAAAAAVAVAAAAAATLDWNSWLASNNQRVALGNTFLKGEMFFSAGITTFYIKP